MDDVQNSTIELLPAGRHAEKFIFGYLSDAGSSGKNNEDWCGLFEYTVPNPNRPGTVLPVFVAVVADGIGGSASGEEASRTAVQTVRDSYERTPVDPTRISAQMTEVVKRANSAIFEQAMENPAMRGMGTTIVMALIMDDTLYLVHAGDSRAYLLRNGQIHLLTLDHSWAQEAIDAGRLSLEEAQRHPNKNVIKRFLGPLEHVDVDPQIIDPATQGDPRRPNMRKHVANNQMLLQPGDVLLLCSDGLNDELSDQQIRKVLAGRPPHQAAQQLIRQANEAGGRDNITAVILQKPVDESAVLPGAAALSNGSSDKTMPMLVPMASSAAGKAARPKRGGRSMLGGVLITLAGIMLVGALIWILAIQGIVPLPGISGGDGGDKGTPTIVQDEEGSSASANAAAIALGGAGVAPAATETPTVEEPTEPAASEPTAESATPSATPTMTETPTPIVPTETPNSAEDACFRRGG